MPDLAGAQLAHAEVDPVDHRVDRGDRVSTPADDGRVVADPADDARIDAGETDGNSAISSSSRIPAAARGSGQARYRCR